MASDFSELAGLEQKLATLLADYHRLRAENESLKRELGRALEHNRSLNSRISAASARLDTLLQQLPESTS
jgi:regulator of replication initiation timing